MPVRRRIAVIGGGVAGLTAAHMLQRHADVHLYEADGMMRELGDNKWFMAKQTWASCMETGNWPGYFSGIGQISPLPWQMTTLSDELETTEVQA